MPGLSLKTVLMGTYGRYWSVSPILRLGIEPEFEGEQDHGDRDYRFDPPVSFQNCQMGPDLSTESRSCSQHESWNPGNFTTGQKEGKG